MTVESYSSYLSNAKDLQVEAKNILAVDPEQKLTWWYDFNRAPENIIESFIFKSARQHNLFHSYVGAEWWIREHTSIESDWRFHTDVDVDRLERDHEVHAAPFSTVTYLCDSGQPTVLVDHYNDWTNTHGNITGENNWTFWSAPKLGKHINWSIPYYHGVPANFGSLVNETRITLMYNVWRWKPLEPACVEYNLPYEISQGEAYITAKKDTELPWLEPHGYFNCELEGYPISMQYHGYYQQHKSWMVSQRSPDHIDTTPRFPTQDSQTH